MLGGGLLGWGLTLWGQIHGLESQSCQDEFREKPKVESTGASRRGKQFNPGARWPPTPAAPPKYKGEGEMAMAGGVGLRGGMNRHEQGPPVPCSFCPYPKQPQRDKTEPSHITPLSLDPAAGHRAHCPCSLRIHSEAPSWAQEGPGPSVWSRIGLAQSKGPLTTCSCHWGP